MAVRSVRFGAVAACFVFFAGCGPTAPPQNEVTDASTGDAEPPVSAAAAALPRITHVTMPTPREGMKIFRDFAEKKAEHPSLATARTIAGKDKWLDVALADAPKGLALAKEGFVSEAWAKPSPTDWSHIGAVLPHRADDPMRISPVRIERWAMSLHPRGFSPSVGELDRGRVVYRDALPHADLIAIAREREVEQLFLLRDAQAPTEIRWQLELGSGLSLRKERLADGSIDFLDAKGDAALRIRPSFAIDASGVRREATTAIEGDDLVVRLDTKGLAFPVLLDPVAEVPVWQQKATTGIPAGNALTLTYSADQNLSLLVGGGTWNPPYGCSLNTSIYGWNGTSWSTISPPSGLLPRGAAAAANYGSGVILFGGSSDCGTTSLGDTWLESGGTWRQVCTGSTCNAPAQLSAGMASLPQAANILSYPEGAAGASEGCWADGTAYGRDLPTYLGTGYTAKTCASACRTAGYAYAGAQNANECWCGNAFGKYGRSTNCTYTCPDGGSCGGVWAQNIAWTGLGGATYLFGDKDQKTYVFANGASGWAQFPYNGVGDGWGHLPAARNSAVMVSDPNAGWVFLFGGIQAGATAPLSDAWLFNPAAPGTYGFDTSHGHWSWICGVGGATGCPLPARWTAQGAYDSVRKKVVIYGGAVGSGDLNDTWEYDAAANKWTQLCYPSCSGVETREGTYLAFDPLRKRTVLAGGYFGGFKSNTYELYVRGGSCASDSECDTGHCFGGTCCESVCSQCQTCGAAGSEGVCTNIPAGNPDPVSACPSGGQCNGGGACKPPLGSTCSTGTDCASGNCVNSTCCSTTSCGGGLTCADPAGTCKKVLGQSCLTSGECASGNCVDGVCCGSASCGASKHCNYSTSPGTCLADNGQTCTAGTQCGSGNCVDGVCCNSGCTGQCQACDVVGNVGTCIPVTGAPHGSRTACAGSGACGSFCNGTNPSACTYPGSTTACGSVSCTGGVQTNLGTCNGGGSCAQTTTSCGNYACSTTTCKTSCTVDADCASSSYYCNGTSCQLKLGNGSTCAKAGSCQSGNCVSGICCDTACTTTGFACNLPGSPGKCTKANGTACAAGTECGSGFCVDGVCCDSTCSGQCQACDVGGSVGKCTPVVGAPHGSRTACGGTGAGTTCGARCDGSTTATCTYPTSSTGCGAATCADGPSLSTYTQLGACNGTGSCLAGSGDCGTYKCSGATCAASCTSKSQCSAGNYCDLTKNICVPIVGLGNSCTDPSACPSGFCVDGVCCEAACGTGYSCNASPTTKGHCRKLQGVTCTVGSECASGNCVDGVCCNSTCTGSCEACNVSGKEGTCTPIVGQPKTGHAACSSSPTDPACGLSCNGTDNLSCHFASTTAACGTASCSSGIEGTVSTCNGSGACSPSTKSCGAYACGTASCLTSCTGDSDCATGFFCKTGTCTAAQPLGESCTEDLACQSGHCATGATGKVCCSVVDCGAGAACAGPGAYAGKCLKNNASKCDASTDCASGHCVDGVCCDLACDGQCEACDVKGSEGTCTPVTNVPHGTRAACDSLAADDCAKTTCDGATRTKCAGFANGTTTLCGKDTCTSDKKLQKHGACDGRGSCALPEPVSCVEYVCDTAANVCKSSCTADTDCADTFRCDTATGKCVQGSHCSDDRTQSIDKTGTASLCAPYMCGADGSCLKSCATSGDCVPGTSCDVSTHACVGVAPEGTDDGGGCGCGVAGTHRERDGAALFAALLGLAAVVDRRRKR